MTNHLTFFLGIHANLLQSNLAVIAFCIALWLVEYDLVRYQHDSTVCMTSGHEELTMKTWP